MNSHPNALDNFTQLCQAVGFLVIEWALIEQQIDNWVNVSFNNCGGNLVHGHQSVPHSLKRKTDFLKRSFKTLPLLAPFASEGLNLLTRISALSPKRHELVHGAITSLDSSGGSFAYRLVGYRLQRHTLKEFKFNIREFPTLEKSLSALLTEGISFSQKLASAFLVEK
jgi:hypothetical protein